MKRLIGLISISIIILSCGLAHCQEQGQGTEIINEHTKKSFKIDIGNFALRGCYSIFQKVPSSQLSQFMLSNGLEKPENQLKAKSIKKKFLGNAYYSCLEKAQEYGKKTLTKDLKSNKHWEFYIDRYVEWDLSILEEGKTDIQPFESHGYQVYEYLKKLFKEDKQYEVKQSENIWLLTFSIFSGSLEIVRTLNPLRGLLGGSRLLRSTSMLFWETLIGCG